MPEVRGRQITEDDCGTAESQAATTPSLAGISPSHSSVASLYANKLQILFFIFLLSKNFNSVHTPKQDFNQARYTVGCLGISLYCLYSDLPPLLLSISMDLVHTDQRQIYFFTFFLN